MITLLISFAIAFVAAGIGYREARSFVRRKLRFVDAVQSPLAPIIAGVGAALLTGIFAIMPLVGLFVGAGTALSVGAAVGMGVAAGAKDAKNGYYLAD
jgi:hypothetical protein